MYVSRYVTFIERIPFYNILVQSHNVTQSKLRVIDPFSIDSDDVSSYGYVTSISPPTFDPTCAVSQEHHWIFLKNSLLLFLTNHHLLKNPHHQNLIVLESLTSFLDQHPSNTPSLIFYGKKLWLRNLKLFIGLIHEI